MAHLCPARDRGRTPPTGRRRGLHGDALTWLDGLRLARGGRFDSKSTAYRRWHGSPHEASRHRAVSGCAVNMKEAKLSGQPGEPAMSIAKAEGELLGLEEKIAAYQEFIENARARAADLRTYIRIAAELGGDVVDRSKETASTSAVSREVGAASGESSRGDDANKAARARLVRGGRREQGRSGAYP